MGGFTMPGMPGSNNRTPAMPFPGMGGSGFGGGFDNGLNLTGAWASGGFNTQGGPPMTGFNQFSGSVPFGGGMGLSAMPMPGLGIGSANVGGPGVNAANPFGMPGGFTTGGSNPTMPGLPQVGGKDLSKIYGKGVGGALANFLNSGAGFNPAVMQAQYNQAIPMANRSEAKMMDIFGNTGNAYSSTAALGIGDFESQFNAALQGEFANEYQQSVQNYLNVLLGVSPSAQQHQAEKPNWMNIATNIASTILPMIPGI